MTGYAEDGGYFSPSLQDEVFQQVTTVPDSVLLHATQLDSIQVNTRIDLDYFSFRECFCRTVKKLNAALCKKVMLLNYFQLDERVINK